MVVLIGLVDPLPAQTKAVVGFTRGPAKKEDGVCS